MVERTANTVDGTGPDARSDTQPGAQLADVSTALVQLYRRFYGRGPTRAKTVAGNDVLTTVLADIFTTVEATLVERGQRDLVVSVRTTFQRAMRHEFVAAVEAVTGRTVLAFSSGVDVDRSIATETFVLEPLDRAASSEGVTRSSEGVARQADPAVRRDIRERARETRSDAAAVRAEARQAAGERERRRQRKPG